MNDSHFFIIEAAQDAAIHAKYITHSLTVRANVSVILDNKELLLKEKYLEGKEKKQTNKQTNREIEKIIIKNYY